MLTMRARNTEHLVAAAKQQDEEALIELLKRCESLIAAGLAAAGLLPSEPLYLDARNQALFTIWQQFPTFRGAGEPCGWMYRIARRSAASRTIEPEIRERRRRTQHQITATRDDLVVESRESEIVEHDLLDQVLDRLDAQDREVIVLRVIQELSTSETAELLFLSEGGVKTRLHRAKRAAVTIARQLEAET